MTIPADMIGAWRRTGLLSNGVRKVDFSNVLWLQTDEWYVDFRTLIDPAIAVPTVGVPAFFYDEVCFAGTLSPAGGEKFRWTHEVDSGEAPGAEDVSTVWRTDGVICGGGPAEVDGAEGSFVEEWTRMTEDDTRYRTVIEKNRVRIEMGRFAVELNDERPHGQCVATRFELNDDGWTPVETIKR